MRRIEELNRSERLVLEMVRITQIAIRNATFGRVRPHWVLPVAGHFCSKQRAKEKTQAGDSEPALPSHRYKEIEMILRKRMVLVST